MAFGTHTLPQLRDGARRLHDFLLRTNGRTAVLTGAGVSTDSGIPDYRGPQGYQEFIGPHSFRQRYWARSFLGWPRICRASPNSSHESLATLETHANLISGLVTQNVDGLHAMAGSPAALEIHGTLHKVNCVSCGHVIDRQEFQSTLAAMNPVVVEWARMNPDRIDGDVSSSVNPDGDVDVTWDYSMFNYPACPSCKTGLLKPNVVFFGENMPARVRDASFKIIDDAQGLLVVGSSLHVYSAMRLAKRAVDAGKPLAILNLGPTRADGSLPVDLRLDLPCSAVLEELGGMT
ncbi:DHS-like NAD/FAD-binding domain-containing protein [Entophlyctis helioformis]|nr:DHS-like NAD/FAD-binding domain-containing protein [Entophlyctis helioformis]